MKYLITTSLLVVAVIHLLPAAGMLGASRVSALYGIVVTEPNLELLLRHRAVLFALLGAFCGIAAFVPPLQPAAFVAAAVSVGSFLLLALVIGGLNAQLSRVVVFDIVAALALAAGALGLWWPSRDG